MHADVGDQIGVGDEEHYRVRWEDGHESLFYPGGDARILQQRS